MPGIRPVKQPGLLGGKSAASLHQDRVGRKMQGKFEEIFGAGLQKEGLVSEVYVRTVVVAYVVVGVIQDVEVNNAVEQKVFAGVGNGDEGEAVLAREAKVERAEVARHRTAKNVRQLVGVGPAEGAELRVSEAVPCDPSIEPGAKDRGN